jgi:hypothetical protein
MLGLSRGSSRLSMADPAVPALSVSAHSAGVARVLLTWFFAQTARARSMSGERPFGRFTGERLPSSCSRYFSF